MAVKYRFKLLEKEIAQINNILSENGVAFSFDEIKNYTDSLEQISPIIHKSYQRYLNFLESKQGG